jgi:hypothetical protein
MPDGKPLHAHLSARTKMRGGDKGKAAAHAQLTPPPMLEHFTYVWEWTLAAVRGMTGGTGHLSWSDIRAWSAMFGIAPSPWEADAMVGMADAYFAAARPPEKAGA